MRQWLLFILVATAGCTQSQPGPPTVNTDNEERYPIVAGDVEVTVEAVREVVAARGSLTEGSKWFEYTGTYRNKSNRPIWIFGGSTDSPFTGIQTRTHSAAEWRDYPVGYCATSAREFEIAPDGLHAFSADLPGTYVGQEFRVMLPYRTERGGRPVLAPGPPCPVATGQTKSALRVVSD